jgi:hypothetical protein
MYRQSCFGIILVTSPYYLMLQDGIPVQSSGFFNHNGLAYTNIFCKKGK